MHINIHIGDREVTVTFDDTFVIGAPTDGTPVSVEISGLPTPTSHVPTTPQIEDGLPGQSSFQSDALIADIMGYEADRLAHSRARREAAKFEAIVHYDDYVTVGCPTCHVGIGMHCVTTHGNDLPRYKVHTARRAAWNDKGYPEVVRDRVVPQACICGHDDVVHYVSAEDDDRFVCVIEACSCSNYVKALPDWLAEAITLDEM